MGIEIKTEIKTVQELVVTIPKFVLRELHEYISSLSYLVNNVNTLSKTIWEINKITNKLVQELYGENPPTEITVDWANDVLDILLEQSNCDVVCFLIS